MDWLLEECIICIDLDHCSRTWGLWPFQSLGKTKVTLVRAYFLPSSSPLCCLKGSLEREDSDKYILVDVFLPLVSVTGTLAQMF